MNKRTDTKKDSPKRDVSLEDLIHAALIERGWLIPQTEEDVLRAERVLTRDACPPLPRNLADPYRLVERLRRTLATAADKTVAGLGGEPREAGADPRRLPSSSLGRMPAEEEEPKRPAYVYVSNDPLDDEPMTDEMKFLILELRQLTEQQLYEEALELARQATELEPDCWRAWISYGSLFSLLGDLDEGEAIFLRVKEEFSDNPKAVAAAQHNRAFAMEVRCGLNPSEEELREMLSLYEDALRRDSSRTNTRASLYINSTLSVQPDRSLELVKDHLQSEGFVADMSLETHERAARGVKTYRFLQLLPVAFRSRLYGAGSGYFGTDGVGAAY